MESANESQVEGHENNEGHKLSLKNPTSSEGGPSNKVEEEKDNSVEEVVDKDSPKGSPAKKTAAGKLQ